jgi:hypothetical protein
MYNRQVACQLGNIVGQTARFVPGRDEKKITGRIDLVGKE